MGHILLLAIMLTIVACGAPVPTPTSTPAPAPTATATPFPDPMAPIVEYTEAMCGALQPFTSGNLELDSLELEEAEVVIDAMLAALDVVEPPHELEAFHMATLALYELTATAVELELEAEAGEDNAEHRLQVGALYLQMRELALSTESIWEALPAETQQVLTENGCF